VCAITELHNGCDQADDQGGEQLVYIMVIGVIQVPDKKAEIQRQRQHNEECEKHLFQVHVQFPLVIERLRVLSPFLAVTVAKRPGDNKPAYRRD
jgi:hypothetical protein